ncbi:hypothetical protein FCV25MIE_16382 [Fagus crenata]
MRRQRQSPLESDDDREASEPTLASNPIATAPLPPNIEEGVHSGDADDSDNMSADFVEGITLDVRTAMGGDPHIPPITELSSQESNPVHVIFETQLTNSLSVEENMPIVVQLVLHSNAGHAQLNVLSHSTTTTDVAMESNVGTVGPSKTSSWKKCARALSVQEMDHGKVLRSCGKRSLDVYVDTVVDTEEPSLKKRVIVGHVDNHSSVEAVDQPHRSQ